MPHEVVGEVVGQVVQVAGEAVADEVHRKFGWKGCALLIAAIFAIGVAIYFALR